MTNVLFIPGRLPGMNEFIAAAKGFGGRGYGYSKLKKQWTDTVALLARARKVSPVRRCRLRFDWCEPKPSRTCKQRDPDNIAGGGHKVVLDGLVEAGVLPDDSAKHVLGWVDTFAVGGMVGVKVTIEPDCGTSNTRQIVQVGNITREIADKLADKMEAIK